MIRLTSRPVQGKNLTHQRRQSAASRDDSVGFKCTSGVGADKPGYSDVSRMSWLILRVKIAQHKPTEIEADEILKGRRWRPFTRLHLACMREAAALFEQ